MNDAERAELEGKILRARQIDHAITGARAALEALRAAADKPLMASFAVRHLDGDGMVETSSSEVDIGDAKVLIKSYEGKDVFRLSIPLNNDFYFGFLEALLLRRLAHLERALVAL